MSANNSTLSNDRLKELLHYDPKTGLFTWVAKPNTRSNRIKIGGKAGSEKGNGYIQIQIDGKNYLAQRLAWLYVTGSFPDGDIDHADGNPGNNVFENLRSTSRAQNIQNQRRSHKRNSAGLLGVHFRKDTKKYTAYITTDRARKSLGCFDTAEAAHSAYLKAKRELHKFCTI